MKKKLITLTLFSTLLLVSGCSNKYFDTNDIPNTVGGNNIVVDTPTATNEESTTNKLEETMSSIKDKITGKEDSLEVDTLEVATNNFNWNLFREIDLNENQFYSALSIEEALGITMQGAENNTKKELLDTLVVKDENSFYENISLLNANSDKYKIANGIWINSDDDSIFSEDFEEFLNHSNDYFDTEITSEPFTDETKDEITEFVKEKTDGFIPDYESELDSSDSLDIINAIYFKADWEKEFEANNTREDVFYGKDNESNIDYMFMYDERFKYLENDSVKILEMPYKDSNVVMDVILPQGEENIKDVMLSMSNEEINTLLEDTTNSYKAKIRLLQMPKFEESIKLNTLKQNLQTLGINEAFLPIASFDKIGQVYISNIYHMAKIKVDEKGTEAAAATEIIMVKGAAPDFSEKIDFVVDKPFVYVIRDTSSNVILFTGIIQNFD